MTPRARPHQLAAPSQPPPPSSSLLVGHPEPVERPGREPLRERPCVEPVGLRARLPDPGVARVDDQHTWPTCGSRIRAISHALPVTSSATPSVSRDSARTTRAPPASSRSAPPSAAHPRLDPWGVRPTCRTILAITVTPGAGARPQLVEG